MKIGYVDLVLQSLTVNDWIGPVSQILASGVEFSDWCAAVWYWVVKGPIS